MTASIIILDFEKSTRVLENVASIEKQKTDFKFEIIIAVNSATPAKIEKYKSLQKYKNIKTVFNKKNLGYTRGTNHAVGKSNGKYIFIINPDIVWQDKNTMQNIVNFMKKNPRVGIVGPKQINDSDGKVAMTVRAFPKLWKQIARRTWLRQLPFIKNKVAQDEMQHLDYSKTQSVDWLQSSFVVIRQDLWKKLKGLDERYFLFMSDPDLCWRTWQASYEVIYYPKVTVRADGLRCSAGGFLDFFQKWTIRQHLRDALKYNLKYFWKKNPRS